MRNISAALLLTLFAFGCDRNGASSDESAEGDLADIGKEWSGQGTGVENPEYVTIDTFKLAKGAYFFAFENKTDGALAIDLETETTDLTGSLLVNAQDLGIGKAFTFARADVVVKLKVAAKGAWSLKIVPMPEKKPLPASLSGSGELLTDPLTNAEPALLIATLTCTGEGSLTMHSVSLVDGNEDLIFNGPCRSATQLLPLANAGEYVLRIESRSESAWTIDFKKAE